jgi:hypothetical protein
MSVGHRSRKAEGLIHVPMMAADKPFTYSRTSLEREISGMTGEPKDICMMYVVLVPLGSFLIASCRTLMSQPVKELKSRSAAIDGWMKLAPMQRSGQGSRSLLGLQGLVKRA